jgi:TRAP-type C4-dicarboxylate transport system permease small subunit
MHRALAKLYTLSGACAALCIFIIMVLVAAQVVLNTITKVGSLLIDGMPAYSIPAYSDFAGFLLVGATFLALPYALYQGGHIRVSLLLQVLGKKRSYPLEIWVSTLGLIIAGVASYYAVKMCYDSWRFNDVSYGLVKISIWIPQAVMCLGLIIFTISLADSLVQLIRRGSAPYIDNAKDELSAE